MNVPPSLFLEVTVQSPDTEVRGLLERHQHLIVNLGRLGNLQVAPPGERPASSATSVFGNSTIFVSLEGVIDIKRELERLNKEITKITRELHGIDKKLSSDDFLQKAPQEVVQKVRDKGEKLAEKRDRLQENIDKVTQLADNS
jgi:valyl-tRNA synthetase